MPRIHYDKLVRDKIPKIMGSKGVTFKVHIVNPDEHECYLNKKLQEEFDEFKQDPCAEEMADIMEVLNAMCLFYKLDFEDVLKTKSKKREEKGAFEKGIILEYVNAN